MERHNNVERGMRKADVIFIIALGVSLIICFIIIGNLIGNSRDYKTNINILKTERDSLINLSKEYLKESERKIDTVYIYSDSIKIQKDKAKAISKDIKKIKNETKDKVKAIDTLYTNDNLKLFHSSADSYRKER